MRIMISCGEASGDLYAAALTAELHARQPDAEIFGFGGQRLRSAGGNLIGDFGGLSVTGLTEAIRVVPRSFAMLRRLVDAAREMRPHVFRSEEHTSELQSQSNLVCRLLLEK